MVGEKALMALEEILSERLRVESVRVTFTIRRSAAMRKVRYMATLVYAKGRFSQSKHLTRRVQ